MPEDGAKVRILGALAEAAPADLSMSDAAQRAGSAWPQHPPAYGS
jgi:hypothetical protein